MWHVIRIYFFNRRVSFSVMYATKAADAVRNKEVTHIHHTSVILTMQQESPVEVYNCCVEVLFLNYILVFIK